MFDRPGLFGVMKMSSEINETAKVKGGNWKETQCFGCVCGHASSGGSGGGRKY